MRVLSKDITLPSIAIGENALWIVVVLLNTLLLIHLLSVTVRTMWTVTAKDDLRLMVIRSDGVFDYRSLRDLLRQIYVDENGKYASYDRFANLSRVEDINIDVDTVVETVHRYRRFKPPTDEVKVAVHLPFGITGSLAQIYKILTETDTLFNLQIFRSVEECAEYLEIDQSMLSG